MGNALCFDDQEKYERLDQDPNNHVELAVVFYPMGGLFPKSHRPSTAFTPTITKSEEPGAASTEVVKVDEPEPPKPIPTLEYKHDAYIGKIEWNGFTSGTLKVTVHKNNDPFAMLELVEAVMIRISKTWNYFVYENETLKIAKDQFKEILSRRVSPEMNRYYGDDAMRNWYSEIKTSFSQYEKLGRMTLYFIWGLFAMYYTHITDAKSLLIMMKPDTFKFEGEYYNGIKRWGEMRRWLEQGIQEYVEEIRNLHLYDKIDPTSQAAGQSAIGQVMVSPQDAKGLILPEDITLEQMISMIESMKGTILIENLNIIVPE